MSVQVKLPTILRQYAGGESSVEAPAGTIGELFAALEKRHPGLSSQVVTSDGDLHRFVNIYLNDEDIRYLQALETQVADGDVVSILPAVAGGARRP